MVKNDKIDKITVCGGTLSIDFINTVVNRVSDPVEDYLADMDDLLYWCRRLEVIDAGSYNDIARRAAQHPHKASAFFKGAIACRELLYNILHGLTRSGRTAQPLLDSYNKMLTEYFSCKNLTPSNGHLIPGWSFEPGSFQYLLAPIIEDSYQLFISADRLKKVKECPKCHWLFLDTTKNGMRRWCTMKTCGASVKALEWYHRTRG